MVINLDFSKEERNFAFSKCGFVTEEITAWYDSSVIQNDELHADELKPFRIETAYPSGQRPEELDKDKPLLSKIDTADDVFAKLLKAVILEKLF